MVMLILCCVRNAISTQIEIAENVDKRLLEKCIKIDNDTDRLACFDRLFSIPAQPAQSSKLLDESNLVGIDSQNNKTESVINNDIPKIDESKNTLKQLDSFGGDEFARKNQPDSLIMSVASVSKNAYGLRRFTMENGQVWRETSSSRLRIKSQDKVTVSKGALSAYFLQKPGKNSKVKVKRVK